ncbi:phosphoribosylanthranilate isomerase [Pseudalkalibacillus sp. SCS-8]|uniref:phosphoribosylanthranilate isomerase n=1 Tax=Pseudalkalibacillus nanhaiensis TaxID=3115291 RepID=UPI0032DAC56D
MTKLKICGARTQEDFHLINTSSADYVGFIFAKSKRQVTPQTVKQWIPDDRKSLLVGVFVDPTVMEVQEVLEEVDLDVLQLHGTESITFIKDLKVRTGKEIWKALSHSERTLDEMEIYVDVVEGFVIDTKVNGRTGGTGVRFDWKAIPSYTHFAKKHNKLCFIAGGLTAKNVQECLGYGPIGIDLSSGVERDEAKSETEITKLIERMNAHAYGISR